MDIYIVLMRGINVGGKNKVSMTDLKVHLTDAGYIDVQTYINSGNIILKSQKNTADIKSDFESQLPRWFNLDSEMIKVLVISKDTLMSVIKDKPNGFGDEPDRYHSDVVFLMDIDADDAFSVFSPRADVDRIWKGKDVIYSRRLSAERTKSHLNRIMISPLYKSMTIRNWNTTKKLYELVNH